MSNWRSYIIELNFARIIFSSIEWETIISMQDIEYIAECSLDLGSTVVPNVYHVLKKIYLAYSLTRAK